MDAGFYCQREAGSCFHAGGLIMKTSNHPPAIIQTLRIALSGAEAEGLTDTEIRDVIMTIVSDGDRELDTKGAADYIGYSAPNLKLWRYKNQGPKYRRSEIGRIRYKVKWLNVHMNDCGV